jgi:chitinase
MAAITATVVLAGTGTGAAHAGPGAAASFPRHVFAPYADVTLTVPFRLSATASAAGVKHVTLGFLTAKGGSSCQAAWGGLGSLTMDKRYLAGDVAAMRRAGGDVIASFGGAAGTDLAVACPTVASLAAQYQSVIDTYGLTRLDFDVEGPALGNQASVDRRNAAIAQVQAAARSSGRSVAADFTLPVAPTGLPAAAQAVLRSAVAHKVAVTTVNIMAMDYGPPESDMGAVAAQAATRTEAQLAKLYPTKPAAALWQMLGITPMIGRNDVATEVFEPADATAVLAFARQHGAGMLAMWSLQRDHPCPAPTTVARNDCSGVAQADWAFSATFGSFES